MVKLFPKKKGRPKRPKTREGVEVAMPIELLDLLEDISHQAYQTRSDVLIYAVRLGLPIAAEKLGVVYDRETKVTYKDRSNAA